MAIVQGETRLVFVTKNYAIKVPNFFKGYKQFLYGLLSNLQEVEFTKKSRFLLPIIFHLPFGILLVMPRAEIVQENIMIDIYQEIVESLRGYPKVDYKPDSFGVWKNNLYVIDYGTTI